MYKQKIYVLITTFNRTELLKNRSLKSVLNQDRRPDYVVLVDDSTDQDVKSANKRIFQEELSDFNITYLENSHTPGAAGNWNTGIDFLYFMDETGWVAILDDDDEWTNNHISICESHIKSDINTVISGTEVTKDNFSCCQNIVQNIDVNDFLKGNPGWQGSNTFMKLSFLKEVGSFDEKQVSTHDRDLAVRSISHKNFSGTVTRVRTMFYRIDSGRTVLTTKGSPSKKAGLLQFWRKHNSKMSEEIKQGFLDRAEDKFLVPRALFFLEAINSDVEDYFPIKNNSNKSKLLNYLKYRSLNFMSKIRVSKLNVLVPRKYSVNHKQIEIDITYNCNLSCTSCNRSCDEIKSFIEMNTQVLRNFVHDSITHNRVWERIRILGGEPTLHSKYFEVLDILTEYKLKYPSTQIDIVTNGSGNDVERKLLSTPKYFFIENSKKHMKQTNHFYNFNDAPKDKISHHLHNYRNGCSNIHYCGLGLSPNGRYYPCAVSGSIDRFFDWSYGRVKLPKPDDNMEDLLNKFCKYCGKFNNQEYIPKQLSLTKNKRVISKTWKYLYSKGEVCEK
ncbi:MAG: glycosyltransferase [Spirochaetaceae bacterium]